MKASLTPQIYAALIIWRGTVRMDLIDLIVISIHNFITWKKIRFHSSKENIY